MPTYSVVIVLAIAGALCLALMAAAARRWPGEGRWSGWPQDREQEARRVVVHIDREVWRRALLLVLRERFGELPPAVTMRVESEDPEWCEEMLKRAATAESLEELGL